MASITVKIPEEKFAAVLAKLGDLTQEDGPLDAVGTYVSGIGMPSYFRSAGGGTWDPKVGGGDPLIDFGYLVSGFKHAFGSDQKSIAITNDGRSEMVQAVQHFGATITATSAPFLTFKIGDSWVKKRSVIIPARQFWLWFDELETEAIAIASHRLLEDVKESFA